ncbi:MULTISPECIES: M23 family metallopeptidase [unclassified Treponema]|uniref:M23 family metallopeptidase n=1 Tax=unclassified Treponema TaxID=2638727 RepID=UPI0020A441DB|nr:MULTISPECIES: M23 family metallopeptidase [unclassified Treponema]UTC67552.1 M23 family metallopeptidase [Treponema sp. OMZ 789]UTC70280.1 M23 family metallopeptidase [Treponema sp. OMZ 790]UTC72995.1 M23 family metallopeptidase [Treponema sp. OMZ 791]
MLKKKLCVFTFFCFLFGLYASGKTEVLENEQGAKSEKPLYIVSMPVSGEQGSFFNVKFKAARKIEKAWITIYNSEEKKVQTINAFPVDKSEKEWAAIAVVAVWWKSGKWKIRTHLIIEGALFEEDRDFEVLEKEFKEFVMKLSAKNTKILKDKSPKKREQRNRFVEVLKVQNFESLYFKGPFKMPFKIKRISSTFAEKRTSKYTDGKTSVSRHWGVDYPAPIGTPIFAPGTGKVVLAENRIVTGWTLVMEHAPAVYTIYYHLNKIHVKEGDFISQGEKIADIGTTGFSTGPHLHWELRINEIPADPELLLTKELF